MNYHYCDAVLEERTQMRGGNGTVKLLQILPKEGLPKHVRLMSEITLDANCSIGPHVHENECEVFYLLSGEGRYLDDKEWKDCSKGDVLTCGYGEQHSIENPNAEPLVLLAVIVTDN